MKYNKTIEEHLVESDNLGQFYNYVNRKLSYKGGVGPLKDDEGVNTDDSQSKASILNEYFSTVFSRDNGQMPTTAISRCADADKLQSMYFTRDMVLNSCIAISQNTPLVSMGIQQFSMQNAHAD